jgi:hypothetical protein
MQKNLEKYLILADLRWAILNGSDHTSVVFGSKVANLLMVEQWAH